ncbi:polysaccharide biosynthesis tyrosine autokinase [Mangrovimicrobium sediminis]|uniref:Polysaccharide biosynthesis tyrosine autokinase n=1 Tax=Mangrovimicrobium sediminis TaxID=2562682 RepID=A0A4Z0M0R1_9GAMM|nr:polysaccharide biosynthesis tyrosine autokinase [Haliea sp. SAOS-164]TGD73109.1 polysaccharide biosynthesis tyrosine autokinase [Haliea sp. SAOS-164]
MMQPLQSPLHVHEPHARSAEGAGAIDILRLLGAVRRYKWGILGLALVAALAAAVFVASLTPKYRATASIVLESEEANVVAVEDVYSLGRTGYEYFRTQFEILRSRHLAERVVRRLELDRDAAIASAAEPAQRPWYKPDLTALWPDWKKTPPIQLSEQEQSEATVRAVANTLSRSLDVEPVEFSQLAYISFESENPRRAAQVANAVAEEFIASNLEGRLAGTLQATEWLSERLATLESNLRDSEQALQDFRDSQGLVSVDGVTGLGGDELRSLTTRLDDARRARIEAENLLEEVRGLSGASPEELMTIPAVLRHELIGSLKEQQSAAERRVAELAKRYGPRHPKMIAAQTELESANRELAGEVSKVVSGIGREYEVALRNEHELQASWNARKSEIQNFNRKEFRLQELQRDVDTNRQLYDIFLTRMKSVSETGGFEKPHARIVDRATVPARPVWPNQQRIIIGVFIAALLLGAGIAVLLDILDNTVKSHEDVAQKLGAVLLGSVPRMKTDKQGRFAQFWEETAGNFAESVRTVRTGLLLSDLDSPPKVILVTSTVPAEGKSVLSLNLASALGQMENTLVIGADLRRPSLARECGLSPDHKGLSHFVSGVAELDECIEYLEDLQVHVMPAGLIPPNPLEMISSRKFVAALKVLRERFDRIVIDSAPVRAVSDAQVLASYADYIVYVVKADATSATQARRGLADLAAASDAHAAVVLNQVRQGSSDSYYHYSGYTHYGESPTS